MFLFCWGWGHLLEIHGISDTKKIEMCIKNLLKHSLFIMERNGHNILNKKGMPNYEFNYTDNFVAIEHYIEEFQWCGP